MPPFQDLKMDLNWLKQKLANISISAFFSGKINPLTSVLGVERKSKRAVIALSK